MTALALLLAALPLRAEPFKGESCQVCHAKVRDADPAATRAEPELEGRRRVVVVGGGLAGLSAAWALKDLEPLVLEKEERAGGKTRRESLGPWRFATGAVYTSAPEGRIREMFKDLRIYPRRLAPPIHVYRREDGKRVTEWITKKGLRALARDAAERKQLDCLYGELSAFNKKEPLTLPMQDSDPKGLAALDAVTFHDYLSSRCGARAAALGDHMARDVFGAGAKDYSAALGLFYMADEIGDSYNWEGGLGEVAEALERKLGRAVRTGALVEEVVPGNESVRVVYSRAGKRFELSAEAVVVAVPSFVAKRIVKGLSARKAEALGKVRYSSYAVMPMRFKKRVYEGSFVLWTPGAVFVDMTFPGGERLDGPKPTHEGQLGEAYLALGAAGRGWLLAAPDSEIKDKVLADLEKVLPGASKEVADWRIVRWGHAMPLMGPGYLTQVQPVLRESEGRLFFAGVDTQIPAIEGAMISGFLAADQARKHLERLP